MLPYIAVPDVIIVELVSLSFFHLISLTSSYLSYLLTHSCYTSLSSITSCMCIECIHVLTYIYGHRLKVWTIVRFQLTQAIVLAHCS